MVAPEIEHANVCVRPIDGFALELMAIEPKQRPKSAVAARLVEEFEAELANLSIRRYDLRRYDLAAMIPRLAWVALRTPPMPYRLLKLAEDHG